VAELNPLYEKKHEETYLNYSRGADAPSALRTPIAQEADRSIANVGDIIVGAIQAKDMLYKDRIRKEVTADVDNWRDPYIGASTSSGSPNPNIPADLRRQIERMDAVAQSAAEGQLTDKHYWMQMENIARATRSRYPGYREYIDNVIADITGGTPANVLANKIQQEAESLKDSATRRRDWVEKELLKKGMDPTTMGSRTTDELEARLAEKNKVEYDIQVSQARTNLTSARLALDDKLVAREANYNVNKALDDNLSDLTADYLKAREAGLTALRDNTLTAGQLAQLEAQGLEYKNAAIKQANAILDGYTNLTPDARKSIIDGINARIDYETQTITKGGSTAKDLLANSLEYTKNIEDRNAYEKAADVQRKVGIVDRVFGGQAAVTAFLGADNGQNLLDYSSSFKSADFNLAPVDFGRPVPKIGEHAADIASDPRVPTKNKGKAITLSLDRHINNLTTNATVPTDVKANIARSLFDEESPNFINRIDKGNNDDIAVFQKMNSLPVTTAMEELRQKGYTKEYNMWLKWRELNFRALYSGELDTMKNMHVNSVYMKYELRPDGTIGINYTFPRGSNNPDAFSIDSRTPGFLVERGMNWALGAEATKDRINGAINAMRPLWDAQGLDPMAETARLLGMNGVDLNATLRPNTAFESFTQFIQGLMDSASASEAETRANAQAYSTGSHNYRMPLGGPGSREISPKDFSNAGQRQLTPVEGIQAEMEETLAIIQESPDPAVQETARDRYKVLQSDLKEAIKQQKAMLDSLENNLRSLPF
jgi:hypothetical protein